MSVDSNDTAIQQLLDREAIRECIMRYCRGIDRIDEQALRSAYWPDATDQHGPYSGSATGFIDWAVAKLKSGERSIHSVSNMSITIRDASAAVETYFQAFQREPDAHGVLQELFLAGRYVDRFEKRNGEWRIAARTVVFDWIRRLGTPAQSEAERFGILQPIGGRCPDDPVYALLGAVVGADSSH